MTSVVTTGGFSSAGLAQEEAELVIPALDLEAALRMGEIALRIGRERSLTIAIEARIGDWTCFHAALPGTDSSNDSWIARKARVVALTGHSTMYERVKAEESVIDWYQANSAPEESHAIHGGGLPLIVEGLGHRGTLLISGLPQVEDHLLGVEVIRTYLSEIGGENE
jgi:uncharacterized protein (UPF0303 family)